jgi:hypothetical protein
MRRTSWRIVSLVLVLSLALLSCDGPNRGANTQPSSASGFNVVVTASPNVIRSEDPDAEGTGGCTQVTIKVSDRQGRLVDGATVDVSTTLGRFVIGTQDNLVGFVATTTRGLVTQTLCAREARGTATITAVVEDAVATTLVTIL